jgi:hypothetical protein
VKREDLARVLGPPGQLSRVEKDAIWQQVRPRRPWWRPRFVVPLAGAVAAAAAVLVVVVARPAHEADTFVARGGSSDVRLVLRCGADREPGTCRRGDHLTFDFIEPGAGHLALFARSPSGVVIWYAPSDETGASLALATHAPAGVLDVAAVIDDSYAPGRYDVTAVLSPQPLTRADIRALEAGGVLASPPGGAIETRSFVVAPAEAP